MGGLLSPVWYLLYTVCGAETRLVWSRRVKVIQFWGGLKMHDPIMFHDLIWFLLVGGFAGWLASVLVTGGGMGILADIAVGVAGAVVGGFIANSLNWYVYGFWGVLGVAVMGAVILLVLFRGFLGPRQKIVVR